jgi:hypothetical protein
MPWEILEKQRAVKQILAYLKFSFFVSFSVTRTSGPPSDRPRWRGEPESLPPSLQR